MHQFVVSGFMSFINVIFPPSMRNGLAQLYRAVLNYICLAQLYIYFSLDNISILRWMCPVLETLDMFTRTVCRLIVYIVRLEVWFWWNFAKVYAKLLRYVLYFFWGYSILVALANVDSSVSIPVLKLILQNTEWIYQCAGQFIDFNVAILKKITLNFCAVPFEQRGYIEQEILRRVNRVVDVANEFINR